MTTPRRVLFPLTAALILGFFLFFIWPSFRLYFDQDDMNNLYFAWSKPASQLLRENLLFLQGAFRPLGQLFYHCVFAIAGFHPLPFRIAAVTLGAVNLALCYRVTELISESRRVAALATLLFTFHDGLIEDHGRAVPDFDSTGGTGVDGIYGNTIVGTYFDASGEHGFTETGGVYATVDDPDSTTVTAIEGISSDGTLVGVFNDSAGTHGFIATPTPGPASFSLLAPLRVGFGLLALRRKSG